MALGRGTTHPTQPLEFVSFNCDTLAEAEPKALGFTYWFEAPPEGEPYEATIRFVGRRSGVQGKPGPGDQFDVLRTVDPVVPGSGRIALTTRVTDITSGRWEVTAMPVRPAKGKPKGAGPSPAPRAPMPIASSSGDVGFAPVVKVRAPGVRLGAWPALVGVGTAVALVLQGVLAAQRGLPVGHVTTISLVSCLSGLVGAKIYYLATHRGEQRSLITTGMSIQGFVLALVASVLVGSALADVPAPQLLDVTAPGLMFGMMIGRLGCFFGGCCVGRPTGARWGLWSSDRSLGMRRIPVQLFESAMSGGIGVASLLAVAGFTVRPDGVAFVATVAAYVLGRQLLFPLRSIPRATTHGRVVALAGSVVVLVAAVVVAATLG